MKYLQRSLFVLCILSFFVSSAFSAVDDVVPTQFNAVWQITASGALTNLSTTLTTQPTSVLAYANASESGIWLKWELGKSGSINKWFPATVYEFILSRYIDIAYGSASIHPDYTMPDCALSGSDIECDEDTQTVPRDVICYSWNFADFIELAAGSLAAGTWTFTGLASATNHVCTFDANFDVFPTLYITTP